MCPTGEGRLIKFGADLARTDPGVLEELCKEIGYTAETVTAVDAMGRHCGDKMAFNGMERDENTH